MGLPMTAAVVRTVIKEHYFEVIACDQNTKVDPKMNIIFTFSLQDIYPLKNFLFNGALKILFFRRQCMYICVCMCVLRVYAFVIWNGV